MPEFIGCWYPFEQAIEENGARRIAHAFEAANLKQARAKATLLFMEEFPDADDSLFELRIYLYEPGVPRPATEWDEVFLFDHEWSNELGHPVVKEQPKMVEFNKLPDRLRVSVLRKFRTTEITNVQLPEAIVLEQAESGFDSHIIDAIVKTPSVISMYPERIIEAMDYIENNCATTKKWPELRAVLADWVKQRVQARKADDNDEPINATEVVPRPYKHTYKTLDQEIAIALWPGDVDPNNPPGKVVRWANGIIAEDREDFKRWSMMLRPKENILKYDRPTISGVVRNVPSPDTYKFPESHGRYIDGYLAKHGRMENPSDETEQHAASATGALDHEPAEIKAVEPQQADDVPTAGAVETTVPVDTGGPFYFLMADGEKVGRANKPAGLKKALADGGTEINQEEYLARKNGTYKAPQEVTEKPTAQTEVKKIADGVLSIDNLMGDQQSSGPSNEVEKSEIEQAEYTSRSEALTKELNGKTGDAEKNLSIWKRVYKTDPARTKTKKTYGTKKDKDGNFELLRVITSINPTYQEQRATELFGPFGIGWGICIEEERFDPGIPFMEPVYDASGKFLGKSPIRNADGSIITSVNHTIRINLWYMHNGEKGNIPAYGHTKYIYQTKSGATCDDEFAKKSLTDATTKALSKLGFSADVYTGLFDDVEYTEENANQFELRNASDKAEEVTRTRKELDEKFKANVNSMRSAVTPNEVSDIASALTRVMGIHLKDARGKANHEYAKYLEGRLRRLEEVKSECISKLQGDAA